MNISVFLGIFIVLLIGIYLIKEYFFKQKGVRIISFVVLTGFYTWFVLSYISNDGGTPHLPEHKNIVFEQKGVYAAYDHKQPVIFVKQPDNTGFALKQLNEKDTIKLQPVYNIPGKIDKWILKSSVNSYPLRVNNKAVNSAEYNRLNYRDKLVLVAVNDSIHLSISVDSLDKKRDIYILNHFRGSAENPTQIVSTDTVYFPKVKDGISLYRLFKQINKQSYRDDKEKYQRKIKYNINDYPIDSYVKNNVIIARTKKVNKIKNINSSLFILQPLKSQFKYFRTYISANNHTYDIDSIASREIIDTLKTTDIISFGYGFQTKFIKLSDKSYEIYKDKDIAPIYFKYPKKIHLPDSIVNQPFLITSWKGFINYDYIFRVNIASNKLPFFAKADFKNWKEVNINTGEDLTTYNVNDDFYVDNGNEGVILNFSRNIKRLWGVNIFYVIVSILVLLFISLSYFWWNKPKYPAQNDAKLIWTFVILVLLFMAILKLIFSYRVASFPPENANYKELDLFNTALNISVKALIAVAILPLIVLLISNVKRLKYINQLLNKINKVEWFPLLVSIIFGLILIIGAVTSTQQSAFGLVRLNILSLVFTFWGMYLFSPFINNQQDEENTNSTVLKGVISYFLLIFSVIVSNLFIVHDMGFLMLYVPVFVLIVPFLWLYWDSNLLKNSNNKLLKFFAPKNTNNKWWKDLRKKLKRGWNIPFITLIFLVFISFLILPELPIIQEKLDDVKYRINADNPEYFLKRQVSDETNTFDMGLFKNNTYQMWQLKNYAANGGMSGVGYAKAKVVNYGTTYPITLTDAFFSTYVLSEFGVFGGITILALFLALFILLIWLSSLLPKSRWKYFWLNFTIGITLYVFAVYMALANIGSVFFTGQNVPFYSLNSMGDFGYFLFVFVLIGLTLNLNERIPNFNSNSKEFYRSKYKYLKVSTLLITILVLISFAITTYKLITIEYECKKDFSLPKDHVQDFQKKIKNGKISINKENNKIQYIKSAHFTEFEMAQIEFFNNRDSISKYNINDGFLYIDKEGKLDINKHYFKLTSPFSSSYIWKGQLYSSNSENLIQQLNFLTTTASAGFGEKDSLYTIDPSNRKQHFSGYKRYNMVNNEHKTIFEIDFDSITYIRPYDAGEDIVFVNGSDSKNKNRIQIKNNDIVLIKKDGKKYYLFLNHVKNNLISRLSWVNGKYKRLYRYGEILPMAYTISKSADYVNINSKKDINLSIDMDMQTNIQRIIREFFINQRATRYNVRKKNLHKAKKYSFTVIDTYTGEVKAMGSWGNFNPNDDKFIEYLYSINPYQQSKVLKDDNLKNHLIGSTFKPLAFASIGLTFNQNTNYDIASLEVFHQKNSLTKDLLSKFNEFKNKDDFTHPHYYLSGISFDPKETDNKFEFWDCKDPMDSKWINSNEFIRKSRNFYMLSLATIGLLKNGDTISNFLFAQNNVERKRLRIKLNNQVHFFDVSNSNIFSKNTGTLSDLSEAFLFKGLDSLFNVTTTKDVYYFRDTISKSWYNNLKYFMPVFSKERKKLYLKNIIPNPVVFDADRPENINYIEAFARGGGKNRWNNVELCEAFARISTGNYVHVNLERKRSENDSIELPNKQWIQHNLIPSLHSVVTNGTARDLSQIVRNNHLYMIAKTGTLKEKRANKPNSGMLMFTIGQRIDNDSIHQFIKGKTYTCYLYLEEGSGYKFPLAQKLTEYLASKINSSGEDFEFIPYEPLPDRNERYPYTNADEKRIVNALHNDNNNYVFINYIDRITSPYSHDLEKISAVFDDVVNKWEYEKDPDSYDYYAPASETVRNRFGNKFRGDCDDFAIFMASTVNNIGGASRIGIGCDDGGCHAWAEIKIASNRKQLNTAKNTIIRYYKRKGIILSDNHIHIKKDTNGNYWMNLDWWGAIKHVGNTPFPAKNKIRYIN